MQTLVLYHLLQLYIEYIIERYFSAAAHLHQSWAAVYYVMWPYISVVWGAMSWVTAALSILLILSIKTASSLWLWTSLNISWARWRGVNVKMFMQKMNCRPEQNVMHYILLNLHEEHCFNLLNKCRSCRHTCECCCIDTLRVLEKKKKRESSILDMNMISYKQKSYFILHKYQFLNLWEVYNCHDMPQINKFDL